MLRRFVTAYQVALVLFILVVYKRIKEIDKSRISASTMNASFGTNVVGKCMFVITFDLQGKKSPAVLI